MEFKDFLNELIKESGATAYRLSKVTGISQGLISDYRSGRSKPSSKNLKKLADYFDVPVDHILKTEKGRENMNKNYYEEFVAAMSAELSKGKSEMAKILEGEYSKMLEEVLATINQDIIKINDEFTDLRIYMLKKKYENIAKAANIVAELNEDHQGDALSKLREIRKEQRVEEAVKPSNEEAAQ